MQKFVGMICATDPSIEPGARRWIVISSRLRSVILVAASFGGCCAAILLENPFALLATAAAVGQWQAGRWAGGVLAILGGIVTLLLPVSLLMPGLVTAALDWIVTLLLAICLIGLAQEFTVPVELTTGPCVASPLTRVHPGDRAAAEHAMARAFRSGVPQIVTCRQRQTDGSYVAEQFRADPAFPVSVPVAPMVQLPDEPWTVSDMIGETAEAIAAARVIEQVHGAAFAFDAAGRFTYATPIAQTSIAMTLEDLNRPLSDRPFLEGGDTGWKLGVHPEDYPAAARALRHSMQTGEPYNHEYRVLRSTGEFVWHRFSIRPTTAADGHITGWYGIGFDIDVYKRTEESLRDRERQLRQMIDAVPVDIWTWSNTGELLYINRRFLRQLGMEEANFADFWEVTDALLYPDDRHDVRRIVEHSLKSGEPFVLRYRRRDRGGNYRWTEGRCEPLHDDDGRIVRWYGVSIDIDDGVKAREKLNQAQSNFARQSHAAGLAELSASIAHEVNQPLAAVIANSHASQRWLSADPPNIERAERAVARVVRDANAAAEVVARIRALFGRTAATCGGADLSAVMVQVSDLLDERIQRSGVQLKVSLAEDLPDVAIEAVPLQQVLINLLNNGIEALEVDGSSRRLDLRARQKGDWLQIEISDQGPGFENPEAVFEPFFTTKPEGMGMGLTICKSIVEAHGGRIRAERNMPAGARFIVHLPVDQKAVE